MTRRLIIVVVEPGEDPVVETDPEESFATYEMVAALVRTIELLEDEALFNEAEGQEEDEEES